MGGAGRRAVLFVDDEPRVLQGLERMLRSRRTAWTLRFAGSAEAAIALLEREAFDAVVTDLRMPGMDGARLLRVVQERWPQAARIVLSGEMDPQAALRAVGCAHQYLLKPCDPDALHGVLERTFGLDRLVDDGGIKSLLSRLHALPSLPAIYVEILAEIQAPNASFRKVGDLIARDVSMTAKILQMVNSAFFGLARRIVSPQEAVALLGWDTVKALVLSAKIFSQFDPLRITGFSLDALWKHCLETSLCARAVAAAENLPRRARDEVFTAGILHDLGKPILAQNFPGQYGEVLQRARSEPRSLPELEREQFGVCHAKLGAYLMGLWGMGEEVVAAIAFHHRPSDSPLGGETALAVHAADVIEHRFSGAAAGDGTKTGATELDPCAPEDRRARLAVWLEVCRGLRSEEGDRCRTAC